VAYEIEQDARTPDRGIGYYPATGIEMLTSDEYVLNANGTAYIRCNSLLCKGVSIDPLTRLAMMITAGGIVPVPAQAPAGVGQNFTENAPDLIGAVLYNQPCPYGVFYELGAG
jgi:hypothetical protein